MFTVYKKIISPESSPVMGPAIAPKEALVTDGPTPSDRNNNNNNNNNNDNNNNTNNNNNNNNSNNPNNPNH